QKPSFVGIARRNLIRLNIYFFLILAADIDRILAQSTLATYVMLVGFFLVAMNFGHAAAVVQFCPEARTWGESMKIIIKRTMLFPVFLLILGTWLAVTLAFEPVTSSLTSYGNEAYVLPSFPSWYTAFTVVLAIPIILYPSFLLLSFLSSAFRSTIDAGARVVLKSPASWLVEGLSHNDSRFNEWAENGKFVTSSAGSDDKKSGSEGLSDKFGLSQTATVFVRELGRQ